MEKSIMLVIDGLSYACYVKPKTFASGKTGYWIGVKAVVDGAKHQFAGNLVKIDATKSAQKAKPAVASL